MMKNFLLIMILLTSLQLWAGKEYMAILHVVDYLNGNAIPGIKVELHLYDYDKRDFIKVEYTDTKGEVHFSWEDKNLRATAYIIDTTGTYRDGSSTLYFYKNKFRSEVQIRLFLQPDKDFPKLRERDRKIFENLLASGQDTSIVDPFDSVNCADFVETSFSGGIAEMQHYINNNIVYPEIAIEENEQGRIVVSFIIEADGTVTNVKIDRGASPALDHEAMRLIYEMPKWEFGRCNGKGVRSKAMIPIVFTLE